MLRRSVEKHPEYTLHTLSLHDRHWFTASPARPGSDPGRVAEALYGTLAGRLAETGGRIVHERLFGDLSARTDVLGARARHFPADDPLTWVQGSPCEGRGFSGLQIRALGPSAAEALRLVVDAGAPRGRAWTRDGATFVILQAVTPVPPSNGRDRASAAEAMFRSAERLLRGQGATYGDVARTWIYIEDILAWYGDFNRARNRCFTDFGLLGNGAERREAERIFLPASTGIEGRNPAGAAAVMDVFAVHSGKSGTVSSRSVSGVRQRSPFRYGSAFSRAMVVDEPECRLVLVSGTASIDEAGASVHLGDTAAQIEQTLKVIQALVREEGAEWENLCEGTVFLKRPEDLPVFLETAKRMGLSDLPTVNVVADVCRDELLFELDAAFAVERRA